MTKKSNILSIDEIKELVIPVLKKNDIVKAGIFGSYAKGKAKVRSDIDFLIEIKGKKSLLDIVGIQLTLKEILKKEVDLIEYEEIHPKLKKQIIQEEVRIL